MTLLADVGADVNVPGLAWTALVGAVLLAFAKVLPPVVDALAQAFERRRLWRERNEDARITDLSEQVDHLVGRVYTLEQARMRQDGALMAHAVWDQQIIELAIKAGLAVPPPPPLYPPPEA